jgi:Tfp pilus assembly PilM family ATPase
MIKNVISKKQGQRRHSDLIGIDFSSTATKVVRLKRSANEVLLEGIDLLPAVEFTSASSRFELPRNMLTHYACLCYSCPEAVLRMVNTPLLDDSATLNDGKIRELLNVSEDFRPSARLMHKRPGRQDSSFLAVAIPQEDIGFILNMFPAGPPAPSSLEVSGLATVSAFLHARGAECAEEAVCLIDAGETTSSFIFLNKGQIVLVGKVDFGGGRMRKKLAADLGIDDELAGSILSDRSINISSSLDGVLGPFAKQISISKDFIERQQSCRITKTYVSGGLSLLPSWTSEVAQRMNMTVLPWSPLEKIQYDRAIVSPDIESQATRFAAAIGAALGGLED